MNLNSFQFISFFEGKHNIFRIFKYIFKLGAMTSPGTSGTLEADLTCRICAVSSCRRHCRVSANATRCRGTAQHPGSTRATWSRGYRGFGPLGPQTALSHLSLAALPFHHRDIKMHITPCTSLMFWKTTSSKMP